MSDINYWEPENLTDAVSILADRADQVRALAGGTDLLVKMKKGLTNWKGIVNLKGLTELKGFIYEGQTISIGALTQISALIDNPLLSLHFPALVDAARSLGTPQVRNLATVGGNLCNASPAADVALVLLMYEARLLIMGPNGSRQVSIQEFYVGPGQTVLQQGEILTAIEIDLPPLNSKGVFFKHGKRKSHEIALVNVAVLLTPHPGRKQIAQARIAVGSVASTQLRIKDAEDSLTNSLATLSAFEQAAELVKEAVNPIDDVRSTASYRKQMVGVLTRRALVEAWGEEL
ncbi:xanthine dehydrogenase family protein subunit M [Desulfosporosinus sp.]|uniref:FAD binding domain-containing protein n=1 Tax=Desulfosporosinus sp. TaxID=157907 RepID=UPI0025C0E283|nr:xanthine dehydrogenase family protein subunit M [Desulfosporosinus sp.]MBC2722067.1 xanthine dehydrogenase family protein subunit M [Desulfosporosinus sp.]MBC2725914.1 xanthine dehydrogenase family protein subunit M [Desulfosporosinus sp.]